MLKIFRTNTIDSGKVCPVYGEKLFYTFYGRPAYRLKDSGDSHYGEAFAPACLLIRTSALSSARRIMPFDSGGYNYYPSVMHPSWCKEDFEMDGPQSPAFLVRLLYKANLPYMLRNPSKNIRIASSRLHLSQYYKLISSQLSIPADERCSTIEVQFSEPFNLAGSLMAVAVPETLVDTKMTRHAKRLNYDIIPYRYDEPYLIGDFYKPLYWSVMGYLEGDGL